MQPRHLRHFRTFNTLFVRAYDECRRAATYLRWHEGDADERVPSLYGGRTVRRPAGEVTEQVETASPSPPAAPSEK